MNSTPSQKQSAEGSGTERALAGAIRLVSGLTLVSRFAGLARDLITARLFGDGLVGSAFRAAYAVPNLFRRLFGEGALSAAFLPEYTSTLQSDTEKANSLASLVVACLSVLTTVLVVLIEIVLILLLVFRPQPERDISLKLVLIMLPMMPMVCLTAIMGGMLQVHGRFGPPAAAPVLLNLFQIVAAAVCWVTKVESTRAAIAVGVAAVVASVGQVAWSVAALRGRVNWTLLFSNARDSGQTVLKRFVPVVIGLGTLQLNTMLDTVIAMWPTWVGPEMFGRPTPLDQSSNAVLSYTQTLYQFPLGVFGLAVATAVFPLLARTAHHAEDFKQTVQRGLRLSMFIGLPASIGLFLVREELCEVIFGGGWGGFAPSSIQRCADTLAGFSVAVWAYSLNHVFARAFYARGDTTTPMRVAMACVVVNLILNFSLIWSMKEAGLAWATATSSLLQCSCLGFLCYRRLNVAWLDATVLGAAGRMLLIAGVMGAVVLATSALLPEPTSWQRFLLRLICMVVLGGLSYVGVAKLLHAPELRWIFMRAPRGSSDTANMSFD